MVLIGLNMIYYDYVDGIPVLNTIKCGSAVHWPLVLIRRPRAFISLIIIKVPRSVLALHILRGKTHADMHARSDDSVRGIQTVPVAQRSIQNLLKSYNVNGVVSNNRTTSVFKNVFKTLAYGWKNLCWFSQTWALLKHVCK